MKVCFCDEGCGCFHRITEACYGQARVLSCVSEIYQLQTWRMCNLIGNAPATPTLQPTSSMTSDSHFVKFMYQTGQRRRVSPLCTMVSCQTIPCPPAWLVFLAPMDLDSLRRCSYEFCCAAKVGIRWWIEMYPGCYDARGLQLLWLLNAKPRLMRINF